MDIEKNVSVVVPEEYEGTRLDLFLVNSLEDDLSRSFLQKLITQGMVKGDGISLKASYKCKVNDEITVSFPVPEKTDLLPWDHPLEVIYNDDDIAIINKEPGIVVHPGAGNRDKTLVNALLNYFPDLPVIGGEYRPGIVHRLDRDTAGIMVIARNDGAHRALVEAFTERRIAKKYFALVVGKRDANEEVLELPLGRHPKYGQKMTVREDGRYAKTGIKVLKTWNMQGQVFSLLDVELFTGRTHQIRVHLSHTGTPIVGDPIYSKKWKKYKTPWLLLQSYQLGFAHPVTGEAMEFSLPRVPHVDAFIKRLDNQAE